MVLDEIVSTEEPALPSLKTNLPSDVKDDKKATGEESGEKKASVSEEVLEKWSDKEGHESEDKFFEILTDPAKFGLRRLGRGETPPDEDVPSGTIYVGRTTREEDWKGEGDIIMWVKTREGHEPIRIDLSTAEPRKPENERHIKKKLDAEEKGGPLYLYLPKWVIDEGSLGGEVALNRISGEMQKLLRKAIEMKKRRLQSE